MSRRNTKKGRFFWEIKKKSKIVCSIFRNRNCRHATLFDDFWTKNREKIPKIAKKLIQTVMMRNKNREKIPQNHQLLAGLFWPKIVKNQKSPKNSRYKPDTIFPRIFRRKFSEKVKQSRSYPNYPKKETNLPKKYQTKSRPKISTTQETARVFRKSWKIFRKKNLRFFEKMHQKIGGDYVSTASSAKGVNCQKIPFFEQSRPKNATNLCAGLGYEISELSQILRIFYSKIVKKFTKNLENLR